jgi:hypothetical protein
MQGSTGSGRVTFYCSALWSASFYLPFLGFATQAWLFDHYSGYRAWIQTPFWGSYSKCRAICF